MKTAFPFWHKRIAPVFDTARQILIVDSEAGMVTGESRVILPDDEARGKIVRLVELEISNLVCGALSRPMFQMATAFGIRVIPFVAGDLDEIVRSWVAGKLQHETCAMPGCRMRRGRRSRDFFQQTTATEDIIPQESAENRYREGQHGRHLACQAAIRRRKQ